MRWRRRGGMCVHIHERTNEEAEGIQLVWDWEIESEWERENEQGAHVSRMPLDTNSNASQALRNERASEQAKEIESELRVTLLWWNGSTRHSNTHTHTLTHIHTPRRYIRTIISIHNITMMLMMMEDRFLALFLPLSQHHSLPIKCSIQNAPKQIMAVVVVGEGGGDGKRRVLPYKRVSHAIPSDLSLPLSLLPPSSWRRRAFHSITLIE